MALFDIFRRRPKAEPAPAAKTAPARQVRRYQAARPNRIAGFTFAGTTLMEENRLDLMGLVNHSRQLAQNNDYYRAFLLMCRRHIIGPNGIALQAMAKTATGALDKADNTLLESAWAAWGKRGNCEVSGRFSWLDMQKMAAMMVPRDGGIFVRFFRGREYGPFGLQIQFLTIDRLDVDYVVELANGGYINGGVECDALDRVVAWWFRRRRPGSTWLTGGERIRVPAADIKYVAMSEDYSVHLSPPWGHTALRRINMLGGFEEAALTAARAGAAKMGFYTRTLNDDSEVPTEEPELEEMEPGMMETLPAGYDVKAFDTRYPDGESPIFVKLMLRGAAAGLGASYNGMANDLEGTNFSSLHVGKAEERDEWRILQGGFADHLHDAVYAEFLSMGITMGALPLPMSKLEKFLDVEWKPRGWQAVNPVDEANSNAANMSAGLTSPQRIVAAKGGDLETIYAEIAEAQALAKTYGITIAPLMAPPSAPEPPAGNPPAKPGA
jgi:lambda family phage portal protein